MKAEIFIKEIEHSVGKTISFTTVLFGNLTYYAGLLLSVDITQGTLLLQLDDCLQVVSIPEMILEFKTFSN